MAQPIFLILHIAGMVGIVGLGITLLLMPQLALESKKKISTYFMSAAHTQLITGFILFFIMIQDVNHAKIGVKMLLAIVVAATATMYRKKVKLNQEQNKTLLFTSVFTAIIITIIAFAW
jgi:hypothetical protein